VSQAKRNERIAMVALGALIVVVIAWYMAFWRPETSHLKAARTSEAQAASQVASDQAQIASLKADAPKVAQEKAVLEKLVQAVPDGPSLDQMLSTINSAAVGAGVTLTDVGTPEPSGWGGSYSSSAPAVSSGAGSITLTLGVTGPQARVLRFVSALDSEPRLYVVSSFTLGNPSGTSGAMTTSLTVYGFFESASSGNPTFPGAEPASHTAIGVKKG
jgi:Tfp pilus assembly protein PilO